ncbi:hypothetical protein F5879DRAFT_904767 [Lentinula edodes]|nr:hypothetical protein F5879DRAFT_904767 [Lentinula edodes]
MSTTNTNTPRTLTLKPIVMFPQIVLGLNIVRPFPDPAFHWFLFVANPRSIQGEGTKLHVTDSKNGVWEFEVVTNFTINSSSEAITTALIIGEIPEGKLKDVTGLFDICEHQIKLNEVPAADKGKEPKFTCRVWMKEAVRCLNAAGYLRCTDVDELEKEAIARGCAALEEIDGIDALDIPQSQKRFVAKLHKSKVSHTVL